MAAKGFVADDAGGPCKLSATDIAEFKVQTIEDKFGGSSRKTLSICSAPQKADKNWQTMPPVGCLLSPFTMSRVVTPTTTCAKNGVEVALLRK